MEPSSDPRADNVSCSDSSSTTSGTCRREDRVLTIGLPSIDSFAAGLRGGRPAVLATRCFGASGGLLAVGWNSIIGRRRSSQLYCLAKPRPLSRGIQVPEKTYRILCTRRRVRGQRTLIFAITPLNLFMLAFLNFALKYTSPLGLVEAGNLEDLGRVQPRVGTPSHNRHAFAHPARVKNVKMRVKSRRIRRTSHIPGCHCRWPEGRAGKSMRAA